MKKHVKRYLLDIGGVLAGAILIALAASALPVPARGDTTVASWNIRHLGGGEQKDYYALATVAQRFDLLAIQEVMTQDGAARLLGQVEALTGEDWEMILSEPAGRGSYKEMHGFLWRAAEVQWLGASAYYPDAEDDFAREPFAAHFLTRDGYSFYLASAHLIYGKDPSEREREVAALGRYLAWLQAAAGKEPVFLAGDFNLKPSNPAWQALDGIARPLLRSGATTLSSKDGRFANLYDNIWIPVDREVPIADHGILEFPRSILAISHEAARKHVSDHAPVWMVLDPPPQDVASWNTAVEPHMAPPSPAPPSSAPRTQADEPARMAIVANRSSGIYHWPGCPGYDETSNRNRVGFDSPAEAVQAGFRPARNCN